MSSGSVRVVVFAVFLVLLLVFAVAYKPMSAASQPASQSRALEPATHKASHK